MSSRPEIQVFEKLNRAHPGAVFELDVQSHPEPVDAYIDYKLAELEKKYMYLKISQGFFPFVDGILKETADPKLSQSIVALIYLGLPYVRDYTRQQIALTRVQIVIN